MFLTGLSKKPDIYERLARAIAPSIYEKEDVKKGILLQQTVQSLETALTNMCGAECRVNTSKGLG